MVQEYRQRLLESDEMANFEVSERRKGTFTPESYHMLKSDDVYNPSEFNNSHTPTVVFKIQMPVLRGVTGVYEMELPQEYLQVVQRFIDSSPHNQRVLMHEHSKFQRVSHPSDYNRFVTHFDPRTLSRVAAVVNELAAGTAAYAATRVHVTTIDDVEFYSFDNTHAKFMDDIRRALDEVRLKRGLSIVLYANTPIFKTETHDLRDTASEYRLKSPASPETFVTATEGLYEVVSRSMREHVEQHVVKQFGPGSPSFANMFRSLHMPTELPRWPN
jgi:hypothetical protein